VLLYVVTALKTNITLPSLTLSPRPSWPEYKTRNLLSAEDRGMWRGVETDTVSKHYPLLSYRLTADFPQFVCSTLPECQPQSPYDADRYQMIWLARKLAREGTTLKNHKYDVNQEGNSFFETCSCSCFAALYVQTMVPTYPVPITNSTILLDLDIYRRNYMFYVHSTTLRS
jgi:hypothetical protein